MTDDKLTKMLDELDALAAKATPGPWGVHAEKARRERWVGNLTIPSGLVAILSDSSIENPRNLDENAAYLAALDPNLVRALVEVARSAGGSICGDVDVGLKGPLVRCRNPATHVEHGYEGEEDWKCAKHAGNGHWGDPLAVAVAELRRIAEGR